jgi:transcriptional regulator with GAF, ATPase, and Fis domain
MDTAADLRRRLEEMEALHELACELLQLEDYEQMLDALVRRSLGILHADRGFLVLRRGEELDFHVVRNWSRDELEEARDPVSRTLVAEALRLGQPLLVEDVLGDERFSEVESILGTRLRSVLAAPLRLEGQIVGALYLESRSMQSLFRPDQLELFRRILTLCSRALEACLKRLVLEQRNSLMERDWLARHHFQGIVTQDPGFLRVLETVVQAAATEVPVLVQGPSGSGKELIVRALHLNSARARRPFLTVNCGAISAQLLESELFGHVRGAFTGATSDKLGLIPAAQSGTLFLDEVGELPKELQVKLLRTLQFGEIQPVGSARAQSVDVRFLAATNRNLQKDVEEGRFREDLLYRLNTITIDLPALKDRPEDVLPLFHHFLQREAHRAGRPVPRVTARLERALQEWDWPGNVRELENEAKRLVALTPPGQPLKVDRLSARIAETCGGRSGPTPRLLEQERELIERHLRLAGGNRTHAARALGISRDGLRKKMKRYGIS